MRCIILFSIFLLFFVFTASERHPAGKFTGSFNSYIGNWQIFVLGGGGGCPQNANNGICFEAGVKGCFPWGLQPAGWWTRNIRCLPNKNCWCYHNWCPPNANNGICFQAGVKGCYRLGWQPAGWTTDDTNCLALMDCFCYKAPPPGNKYGMEYELKYVKK